MTEPRSTPKKMTAVEIEKYMLNLESSLARQSALLRRWMEGRPDGEDPRKLLEDTERELEGK